MAKIDVSLILTDHFGTLRNYGTGRLSVRDLVWFFGVPIAIAAALVWADILLEDASIAVLVTALSIFAGLLLNLLLLTHGIVAADGGDERSERRRKLIEQTYKNISYSILIALTTITVLVFLAIIPEPIIILAGSGITYALVGNFILTLLMVLKRIHVMLRKEYETQ